MFKVATMAGAPCSHMGDARGQSFIGKSGLNAKTPLSMVTANANASARVKTNVARSTTEDFYSVLGVQHTASNREIKQAYYNLMKRFHPDRLCEDETNDLCALLNEIYTMLSDPQKRAAYDDLAGYSLESVSPFFDRSQPLTQVFVDEASCTGCLSCALVCPKTFMIEEQHGRARVVKQTGEPPDAQQEAVDTCPVSCIHWVSERQLPYLEAAMERMTRVDVFAMKNASNSSKGNVFYEAQLLWQHRQSAIQERLAANSAVSKGWWWAGWGGIVRQPAWGDISNEDSTKEHGPSQSKNWENSRQVGKVMARAASSMRMWKMWRMAYVRDARLMLRDAKRPHREL